MAEVLDYLKTNQEAYTVVGILLTLFISLISLWFTVKNNKAVQYVDSVTKNRIEWIDKLRKNISDFLALLDTQDLTDTILTPEEASKYPFGDNLQRLNQLGCEIKLMLNFSDSFDRKIMHQIDLSILGYKNLYISSQSSILAQMKSGEKLFVPDKEVTDKQKAIMSSKEKLLSDMQIYLKSEWNRVKYEFHSAFVIKHCFSLFYVLQPLYINGFSLHNKIIIITTNLLTKSKMLEKC